MKRIHSLLLFLFLSLIAFFPVFTGKIPLNARNLVAFFSPWYYEKFPDFPIGVPSKPGMLDQIRLYYPYMQLTQESYRMGELPLWNPYNFMGNPHMAEWQSGAFYPLHILLPFLPLPVYWSLFQIVGFFLAGLFTFLFLKNLELGTFASVFGGVTYMLSSFMTTWNMEVVTTPHSILWLPLILFSIDKLLHHSSPEKTSHFKKWWLIGLTSIVLSILSGYWQTTLYVIGVAAIYAFYRTLQHSTFHSPFAIPKPSLMIFAWFPLALSLTAFHLLPTAELYQRSSRPVVNRSSEIQEILKSYLLPARHLITLFAPDYFGHPTTRNYFANVGGGTYYEHQLFVGTIAVLLAIIGIIIGLQKKDSRVIFWTTIGLISASFSFRTPWARWVFDVNFPVLSTGIANRILFVPAFALAVLAAFGLHSLEKKQKENRRILFFIIGSFALGIIMLGIATIRLRSGLGAYDPEKYPANYLVSLRNLVIPTTTLLIGSMLLFCGIAKKQLLKISLIFIILLQSAQLLYQHYKFTAFSEMQFVYPWHSTLSWIHDHAGYNRFIGYNGQYLNNNFATQFNIFAVEGYDSLNDYRRSKLVHTAEKGLLSDELPRSADTSLNTDLTNPRTIRLMKLFGIRYFVDHPDWLDAWTTESLPRLPSEEEHLVFQDGDWRIFEFLDAFPRAFLVGRVEFVEDGQPTIDRLFDSSFSPRESILLPPSAKSLIPGVIAPDQNSSAQILSLTPNTVTIKTHSQTDQLLFLSDTWYPGWHAKLEDGRMLPILTADYALRAVSIPPGDHIVKMYYFPESFQKGAIISVITLLLTIGPGFFQRRKTQRSLQ